MAARGPDASHRIVVLHGKDSFLRIEWTRRLRDSLTEKFGAVDEFSFDGATTPLSTVLDELRSYGLMAGHKLVVVDEADQFFSAEERRRAMERYAAEPMAEATLLLRAQNWRPGNFDKAVAKVGVILKCEAPTDADAARWCGLRAEGHHRMKIEPAAAALLVERVGPELARLDSELGKLAVGAGAAGKSAIDRAMVIELVGTTREEQAWEIQEAILTPAPGAATRKVLELLRISKAPEVMMAWAAIDLARKVHAAAELKEQGMADPAIAGALRLWGDSTGPIIASAKRIGSVRAADALRRAIDGDREMKSGSAPNSERALIAMCTRLSQELVENSSAQCCGL